MEPRLAESRSSEPRRRELGARVASAAVMGPATVAAAYAGSPWFPLLILVLLALMSWEWSRLCDAGRFRGPGWLLAGGGIATVVCVLAGRAELAIPASLVAAVLVFAAARLGARPAGEAAPGWLAAGPLYLALPAAALLWLRQDPEAGRGLVIWLLAVVWATDIAAFFAGRAIGGPRLAARISPNKTWSGACGGIVGAVLVGAALCGVLLPAGLAWAVAAAASVAVAAIVGDLFESAAKRRFRVKDASGLIPGHGGVLDRVDGLLTAAPLALLLWRASGTWT